MSERSISPCSDRNLQTKRKKIHKYKHDQSQKIVQSCQSKITYFFRNIQKKQHQEQNPPHKYLINLEFEIESLKQQQQNLIYEKQHLQQQFLQIRQQYQNWIRKSRYLIHDCICQIYSNIRINKNKIDLQKGFYDPNCRTFYQGNYGISHLNRKNQLQCFINNKQYSTKQQKIMLQQFLSNQKKTIKQLTKQLTTYKQRLKNAYQQKTCKFIDTWPLLKNKYQILQLIGKGGFSQVYKAYDLQQNKFIAIKISSIAKFNVNAEHYIVRQYQNHLQLNHPNIAKLYQVVQVIAHNSVCIALEYCEGTQLSAYMKQYQRVPQDKAKYIILQILQALNYLSSLQPKIIHYDLKPQNIMFNNGKIKILDFGLSKQIDSQHSKIALSNQGMGTYWYLPPQSFSQKNPHISSKVDIWSTGVILYQMLFGKKPFGHNKSQNSIIQQGIILDANQVQFPDDIEVSNSAKSLIIHCLAYNPDHRFTPSQALSHQFFK